LYYLIKYHGEIPLLEKVEVKNANRMRGAGLQILQYVENTHAMTHNSYKLEVLEVFRVTRQGEEDHFKTFGRSQNRMLLWHGSRLSNWTGILSQGLRIAPPEAPVSGYMFGKGVYFADMVSKSANYCCTSPSDPIGVLLLCEVNTCKPCETLISTRVVYLIHSFN
jgi:hypothetical protein